MQVFLNPSLKPYNALTREEKHVLLDAHINKELEVYNSWNSGWKSKDDETLYATSIYRTKPKEYKKLDIPWKHIDEKWRYAAMDYDERVCFFENQPSWSEEEASWLDNIENYGDYATSVVIKLDTTGIVAEHSLTQRPTGSDTMRPDGV